MYATEYGWSPHKFLAVAQVRASGDLFHKLEGMQVRDGATVDTILDWILEVIVQKTTCMITY